MDFVTDCNTRRSCIMASELRVNTLKDASGNNSVATSVLFGGSAKAWVQYEWNWNFRRRDSYNIALSLIMVQEITQVHLLVQ